MTRAAGCRVWDAEGREYVDYVMALGAVALGYGHPEVNRAAERAIAGGVAGPLPPVLEEELADALAMRIPSRAGAVPEDGCGSGGRRRAAGACRHRPRTRARLWVPRLARLVPGWGRSTRDDSGTVCGDTVQRRGRG